jgi:vacuolar-type H+-ATPase subunit H
VAETLSILRDAEQAARHQIEQAKHDASVMRAGLPAEIEFLREEKNRRLQLEKRKLEAASRKEVEAAREALAAETDGRIASLSGMVPALEREAVSILRSLLEKG